MSTISYARVSRFIAKGEPIADVRDLVKLAEEKKSVVVRWGSGFMVRPAAYFLNWSLGQVSKMSFFQSIKLNP